VSECVLGMKGLRSLFDTDRECTSTQSRVLRPQSGLTQSRFGWPASTPVSTNCLILERSASTGGTAGECTS